MGGALHAVAVADPADEGAQCLLTVSDLRTFNSQLS